MEATQDTRDIEFKKHVAVALLNVRRELLHDAKLDQFALTRLTANELTLRLEKLIYANPLGRLEVSYPASPWEHFRAMHFSRFALGRWFLRRKPVRETTVVKSAFALFPEAHIVLPEEFGRPTIALHNPIPKDGTD